MTLSIPEGMLTAGQKVAVSLLLSVILFAAFTVAAFAGLFTVIETRFYQPAIIRSVNEQLQTICTALSEYNDANIQKFGSFVRDDAVKRSILPNQSSEDIFRRTNLAGTLTEETPGLLGIRILDSGGRRQHFSTFPSDILKREDFSISYSNYGTGGTDEPDYTNVMAPDGSDPRIIFDTPDDRLIYAFPFYDSYSAYRGTVLFYVSAGDLARYLVSRNLIRINDSLAIAGGLADSGTGTAAISGIILGLPRTGADILINETERYWHSGQTDNGQIAQTDSGAWLLFSAEAEGLGLVGRLYRDDIFDFPDTVKILLLCSVFITLFLIIFLFFNLKQDDMVVIRDRIRRLQFALISEYMEKGEEVDWNTVSQEIAYRKNDISKEIKKSLGKRAKRHTAEFDALLDKSWDEILSALSSRSRPSPAATDDLKLMLEQVLKSGAVTIQAAPPPSNAPSPAAETRPPEGREPEKTEDSAELEDIPEAESAELTEDTDSAVEAEELEEIPEAESADETEELEDIPEAESAELTEDTDSAVEAEELEDIPETESAAEIEEFEDISEAENAEPPEATDSAAEAEELEDIPETESAAGTEELEDIPEAENTELTEATDSAAEIEGPEDITEAEELEDIPEAENAEPPEATDSAAEIEGFEDIPAVVPAREIADAREAGSSDGYEDITETKLPTDGEFEDIPLIVPAQEIAEAREVDGTEGSGNVSSTEGEGEPADTENPESISDVVSAEDIEELESLPETGKAKEWPQSTEGKEEDYSWMTVPVIETEEHGPPEDGQERNIFLDISAPDYSWLDEEISDTVPGQASLPENSEPEAQLEDLGEPDRITETFARAFTPYYSAAGKAELLSVLPNEEAADRQREKSPLSNGEETIIVEDGVFRIKKDLKSDSSAIDPEFKRLVDSVLK